MNAFEKGHQQGKDYIALFPIQNMTFAAYTAMGRTVAQKRYKHAKSQEDYRNGWKAIGEQFQSSFKLDDQNCTGALVRIDSMRKRLLRDHIDLKRQLLGWRTDDLSVQTTLKHASYALQEAEEALHDLMMLLQTRER